MSSEYAEGVSRDGKIGRCGGCDATETYLALTRNGYRCADCLTPEGLADVLNLRHSDSTDKTEVSE